MEYAFGDITVACSNVDRVVFPEDGITKGEVIAYYHDVAALMMPELRGRPLTVVRYTKGIDRGGFFQKHYQKHFPAWLDRVAAGTKTVVEYPIVDAPAGVVYMANQGAIEFHVWTSRKDGLDRPDLLVFDLDPPEGRFDLARRAAGLVRGLLDELGLPAFVKLTGGKGLHVVAPLDDGATFDRSETGGGDPDGSAGGAGGRAPRGFERSETGGGDPDGSAGGAGGRAPRGFERSETEGGDPDGSAGGAGGRAPRGFERSETEGGDPDGSAGGAGGRASRGFERSETEGGDPDGSAGGAGGRAPRGIDEVGELAVRSGALLCRRHPDLLTMEFYKKDRRGRLFVDVMRNAIGATLVAPYSLRGRPGAPVSAPIAWSELDDPALCADGIRLRDVRARLDRRGDPWHALRARAGVVRAARRALAALADGENLAPG